MDPIEIVEYDPLWPTHFETLLARIAPMLGDTAYTIEHVGSTAVPGLAAKPIIDIDVLLHSVEDLPLAMTRLASVGYAYRGDLGIPGREAFTTPPSDIRHHLYVCPPDSPEYARHLAFRDYLRTHPSEAAAYADLKRGLAAKFRLDRDAYNRGKAHFVENILRRAGQEA